MRFVQVLLAVASGIALTPGAFAQTASQPFDPATESAFVEIGPVAGLTTTWHPAPRETGVPRGGAIRLRVRVPPGAEVTWSGAREIERNQHRSVAELAAVGTTTVEVGVRVDEPEGPPLFETLRFDPVEVAVGGPAASRPRLSVELLAIDPANPNAATMALYFQGSSIAALTETAGAYRTSTNRWLTLATDVTPTALAPLVEWRVDGKVLRNLGSPVRLQVFTTGSHEISASVGESAHLETYRVQLTSPRRGEPIATGRPVTFTATTDPAGFESEITWLASTKYGHCEPLQGRGAEFTTTFADTLGESGSWLGVRADDAILGLDTKGNDCADFQRTAVRALEILPELPEEPSAFRDFLARTRELAEDSASGAVCAEGRLDEVVAELGGLGQGFEGGIFVGGLDERIESCVRDCDSIPCQDASCDWEIACIGSCLPPGSDLMIDFFSDDVGASTPCGHPRIQNVGTRKARSTTTEFTFTGFGACKVVRVLTPELAPGASIVLDPQWPVNCLPSHVLITADEDSQVAETNESNNQAQCTWQ